MRPDLPSEPRSLTRLECRMHELLLDMAAADRAVEVALCRAELGRVSVRRARAAAREARGEDVAA